MNGKGFFSYFKYHERETSITCVAIDANQDLN